MALRRGLLQLRPATVRPLALPLAPTAAAAATPRHWWAASSAGAVRARARPPAALLCGLVVAAGGAAVLAEAEAAEDEEDEEEAAPVFKLAPVFHYSESGLGHSGGARRPPPARPVPSSGIAACRATTAC